MSRIEFTGQVIAPADAKKDLPETYLAAVYAAVTGALYGTRDEDLSDAESRLKLAMTLAPQGYPMLVKLFDNMRGMAPSARTLREDSMKAIGLAELLPDPAIVTHRAVHERRGVANLLEEIGVSFMERFSAQTGIALTDHVWHALAQQGEDMYIIPDPPRPLPGDEKT